MARTQDLPLAGGGHIFTNARVLYRPLQVRGPPGEHLAQGAYAMTQAEIRRATGRDGEAVRTLLKEAGLPVPGLTERLEHFLVAVREERVVGAIGLELYPPLALLRSAVVSTDERGHGTGARLVQSIEDLAQFAGIQRLVLLTTTAEKFFAARGYRVVDRGTITGPITSSAEFTGACPSSAVCMEKPLL